MVRSKLLMVIGLVVMVLAGWSQERLPAFEMNERLGRGINMGNSFEAPSETAWGNPWKPEYFKIIAELGFDHVRLPVRWEPAERSMTTSPYTINSTFLNRIQQVVDTALKYKLHIIVNMHHHEALYENPAAQKERFLSQWQQIADHFKEYPDSLLFEVLNEPHGNLTPALWNEYFADALAVIRQTNPTRVVLLGVADYGGLGGISKLELPDDEYIILSPHYYNPMPFTHQGADWVEGADAWLGTEWLDTEIEREAVASEFSYAIQFSQSNHIPIHVGEFGAYERADMASRERWTTFLARWFEEQNFSWAYWEFSAGFGIYNPSTKEYVTALVDALLHSEMPEAIPVTATPVYNSNFSNGTDGWTLSQQGGAAGSASTTGGSIQVSISNGGTEGWHLQLVRNNIRLEKDKLYRISFTATAAADRSVYFYAGRASSPWNIYGGGTANVTTTEATYTYTFTMSGATDPAARLVFDLGLNTTAVTISNVTVDELSIAETPENPEPPVTNIDEHISMGALFYPNPVSSSLMVKGLIKYNTAQLIDMKGQVRAIFKITPDSTSLDFERIPPGMYVLWLRGDGISEKVRVIKK